MYMQIDESDMIAANVSFRGLYAKFAAEIGLMTEMTPEVRAKEDNLQGGRKPQVVGQTQA